MRMEKRLLCCFFIVVMLLNLAVPSIALSINMNSNAVLETKVICNATLEDDFADDRVMVVLSNAQSLKLKSYSTGDFSEVGCEEVTDITLPMKNQVQVALQTQHQARTSSAESFESTVNTETYHQILCLKLNQVGKSNVLKVIKQLEQRDDVVYAGPDYVISASSVVPNDPDYSTDQWAPQKIGLPQAWEYTTGSSSISIGILDTGIDSNHPDLVNQIATGLVHRSFIGGTETVVINPTDSNGHGTHVAGIVGAVGNNGIGISGVCWQTQLISLEVLDANCEGYASWLERAIMHAQVMDIPILNFSGVYYPEDEEDPEIFDYALYSIINDYSGLLVCAAGNNNRDNTRQNIYPANYQMKNLICVGSSNRYDRKSGDSNYGKNVVDIFAPGNVIYSLYPDSEYETMSGTSMATPYVTGVAALMMAENPHLTPAAIKQIIIRTADTVYDENGNSVFENLCVSGGRLNAYAALQACHLHDEDSNIEIEDGWHTVGFCEVCEASDIEQPHDLIPYETQTRYEHLGICACGYVQYEYHIWSLYVNSITSNSIHYVYCECGYYDIYSHVYVAATLRSNYNWVCRDCGKTSDDSTMPNPQQLVSGESMILMSAPGVYTLPDGTILQILTETGSYVLSNGVIVLSPEDAALADAGLLDPYELVENITVPSNPGHVTE